jgi:hypothetical protein
VTPPTCAECGEPWLNEAERWRSYVVAETEREHEFEGPDVASVFCPGCAEQEFDDGA